MIINKFWVIPNFLFTLKLVLPFHEYIKNGLNKGEEMKSSKIFTSILLIACLIAFNFSILNVKSQTTTDNTYTIVLKGSSLNSLTALNVSYTLSPTSGFQLDPNVNFKATGATVLLSNVDTAKGIISIVWTGNITDGTITISGKLTGSPTSGSKVNVNKVEKSGGVNITSSVQATSTVNIGSTTPVDTTSSSGSTSSTSSGNSSGTTTSSTSSSGSITETPSEPSVTITGPEQILVQGRRVSPARIRVSAVNFDAPVKCILSSSDTSLGRIKPKTILITKPKSTKLAFLRIPLAKIKEINSTPNFDDSVVVDVTCDNDVSDAIEVIITNITSDEPTDETITEN